MTDNDNSQRYLLSKSEDDSSIDEQLFSFAFHNSYRQLGNSSDHESFSSLIPLEIVQRTPGLHDSILSFQSSSSDFPFVEGNCTATTTDVQGDTEAINIKESSHNQNYSRLTSSAASNGERRRCNQLPRRCTSRDAKSKRAMEAKLRSHSDRNLRATRTFLVERVSTTGSSVSTREGGRPPRSLPPGSRTSKRSQQTQRRPKSVRRSKTAPEGVLARARSTDRASRKSSGSSKARHERNKVCSSDRSYRSTSKSEQRNAKSESLLDASVMSASKGSSAQELPRSSEKSMRHANNGLGPSSRAPLQRSLTNGSKRNKETPRPRRGTSASTATKEEHRHGKEACRRGRSERLLVRQGNRADKLQGNNDKSHELGATAPRTPRRQRSSRRRSVSNSPPASSLLERGARERISPKARSNPHDVNRSQLEQTIHGNATILEERSKELSSHGSIALAAQHDDIPQACQCNLTPSLSEGHHKASTTNATLALSLASVVKAAKSTTKTAAKACSSATARVSVYMPAISLDVTRHKLIGWEEGN